MKKQLLMSALFAAGLCAAAPASATVLYDDGPINGNVDAWTINSGFSVADTFNLSGNSKLTSIQNVGLWLFPGDTVTSLSWSILTNIGGTLGSVVASGTSSVSLASLGPNAFGYSLYSAAFSLPNISLASGHYWIELSNASVPSGDPAFWDMNGGPSQIWESGNGYNPDTSTFCPGFNQCSDPFQIVGTAAVPEPGSLALLGAGLAGLGGWRARRKAKKTA